MAEGAYLLSLGTVPYREAWELQRSLAGAVSQGAIPDTVILLEHPPVVTLGRGFRRESLPLPREALAARGIDVFEIERGGDSSQTPVNPSIRVPARSKTASVRISASSSLRT